MDGSSNQDWWQQWPPTDSNQPSSPENGMPEGFEGFYNNEPNNLLTQELDGLHIDGHGIGLGQPEYQGWALTDQQQQLQEFQDQQQQLDLSTMDFDTALVSMGAHLNFPNEMPHDLQMGPDLASHPPSSPGALPFVPADPADPWNTEMLDPDWFASSSNMASSTWLAGFSNTNDAELGYFDVSPMTTPSSMAVEFNSASSSSNNNGLQSAAVEPFLEAGPANVAGDPERQAMTLGSATTSAQGPSEPAPGTLTTTTAAPFPYTFFPCAETFSRQRDLRHKKKHTHPFHCPVPHCDHTCATRRETNRHLWSNHRAFAERENIPSEQVVCPVPGCGKTGRSDNMKRHVRTRHKGQDE